MDYVDLYQIHRWDKRTPIEETMEALHDVVRAGKARYIGASSMFAWQFAKAQHVAERNGCTPFVSMQNHYNLVYREEEREMIPLCVDQGVGVIPWSPLARGVLAGNRSRDGERRTARSETDQFTDYLYSQPTDFDVVEGVAKVAAERGVPPAQVALAWMLGKPGVTAPIIGATKLDHLTGALAAEAWAHRRRGEAPRGSLPASPGARSPPAGPHWPGTRSAHGVTCVATPTSPSRRRISIASWRRRGGRRRRRTSNGGTSSCAPNPCVCKSSPVWRHGGHVATSAATIALVPGAAGDTARVDQFDLGQAALSIMLAAADLGIGSGHSAVEDQDLARRILGFPDDRSCALLIPLRYPVDRPPTDPPSEPSLVRRGRPSGALVAQSRLSPGRRSIAFGDQGSGASRSPRDPPGPWIRREKPEPCRHVLASLQGSRPSSWAVASPSACVSPR